MPKKVLMAAVAAAGVLVATSGTAAAATPVRSVTPVLSADLTCTAGGTSPLVAACVKIVGGNTVTAASVLFGPAATATVKTGAGTGNTVGAAVVLGSGTATSTVLAGANNTLVSTLATGNGSATSSVNGSGNITEATSALGGTAITGTLSTYSSNNNGNKDVAAATGVGARALAGENVIQPASGLPVQTGGSNNGNFNTATATGDNTTYAGAGEVGSNNVGNTTLATAVGAGSVANAVAGQNLITSFSAKAAPPSTVTGIPGFNFARTLPAASAVGTVATAEATLGGNARAQTFGLNTTSVSTADGPKSQALSVASGDGVLGGSKAVSAAALGGIAVAIASGGGLADANAVGTGAIAVANAAGAGISLLEPHGGVAVTASATDLAQVLTITHVVSGGSIVAGCGAGAHGYGSVTSALGTNAMAC